MPDVLFEIFEAIAVEEDPFRPMYSPEILRKRENAMHIAIQISTVCKTWRSVALNISQIWTTIPSVILPLEGSRKAQQNFADCIAELVSRGSRKNFTFYLELRSGTYRSNCHRVIESLLQSSPNWYFVCISVVSVDAFAILNRLPDSLDRLKTVSLIFRPALIEDRCVDMGILLRRTPHLQSLHLSNAHVVHVDSWNFVSKYDLQSLSIATNGFNAAQEMSFKRLFIPDVNDLILRAKNACPATIVTQMMKNSMSNAIKVLSLDRDSQHQMVSGAVPTLLEILPFIIELIIPLPCIDDINRLAKGNFPHTLRTLSSSCSWTYRKIQISVAGGTMVAKNVGRSRMLGRYRSMSNAHQCLMQVNRFIFIEHQVLPGYNESIFFFLEIRMLERVTYGDIERCGIDLKLYNILQDVSNGDITDQYTDIITEIFGIWDNILHTGINKWCPFRALQAEKYFNVIYEPRPYDGYSLRQVSYGLGTKYWDFQTLAESDT